MKEPYIFISYARKDGEAYSAWLRKKLIPHFGKDALWRDRDRMEGALDWWNQIRAALDQVEYMVLLATPAAMQSETVKQEWRYARSQGVCVYPVKVPSLPIDFNSLSKWMKDS